METTWRFAPLGEARAELGESPTVTADGHFVWWVDISGRKILRTAVADGATQTWPAPQQVGFIAELPDGRLVAGMESGVFEFTPPNGTFAPIPGTAPGAGMRFNDAMVDPLGRLWAGTMLLSNDKPAGALYLFDAGLAMHQVAGGLITPNGLAFDVERGRLYWSDSHPEVRIVWTATFDPEQRELTQHAVFAAFTGDARPDGATLDAAGDYWIAALEASALLRFSPQGGLVDRIAVPVRVPTKPAFGAAGELYVTSKAFADDQLGGRLLRQLTD